MLKPTNNNPRRDALGIRERENSGLGHRPMSLHETRKCIRRNQRVAGEFISFMLASVFRCVLPLNKDISTPMEDHVSNLVKQTEPKDVCPLSPKTVLNERLSPHGCQTCADAEGSQNASKANPLAGARYKHLIQRQNYPGLPWTPIPEMGLSQSENAPVTLTRDTRNEEVKRNDQGRGAWRGVNIGTGGPPSVGVHATRTGWPMPSASKSQSTRPVIMVTPSSSVT